MASALQLLALARAARTGYKLAAHPKQAVFERARELFTRQAKTARLETGRMLRSREFSKIAHEVQRKHWRDLAIDDAKEVAGRNATQFSTEVMRYARGGSGHLLRRTLEQGRLGHLWEPVEFLLGRSHHAKHQPPGRIEEAIKLLTSLGFKVVPPSVSQTPPTKSGVPVSATTSGVPPALPGSASGTGRPANSGAPNRGVLAPPGLPPQRGTPPPQGAPPQNKPPVGTFPGQQYIDMIGVASSNVYAIGYNDYTHTMRVQYLASDILGSGVKGRGHSGKNRVRGKLGGTVSRQRGGPGPVYDYYNVPPQVFEQIASATSKGRAIWDKLRIRGTIYGHRYDYRLVGASVNRVINAAGVPFAKLTYVPRKAVGPGAYKSRTFKQGNSVFRSLLPSVGV